jgi:hypothetical protein
MEYVALGGKRVNRGDKNCLAEIPVKLIATVTVSIVCKASNSHICLGSLP